MALLDSPPYPYLSAKYKGSYAYLTVKDRMPVILTKVIDFLCRNKKNLENLDSEASSEDVKSIIGKLSKLRSEMQTNKPMQLLPIDKNSQEYKMWNSAFEMKDPVEAPPNPKWFESPWLLVECYMYRAICCALEESIFLKSLDPFAHLKNEAFENTKGIIHSLAGYTMKSSITLGQNINELEQHFTKHIEAALWGNRNDLSVSGGDPESKYSQVLDDMHRLQHNILINDTNQVWEYVKSIDSKEAGDVTIIMDNCGLELVADLCLAVFLVTHGFFKRVSFYVKKMPWFVSDVTSLDFHSTLQLMKQEGPSELQQLADRATSYLSSGEFQLIEESYWTTPLPYSVMEKEDPMLFQKLSSSQLLIFKGDLNYRKLGGDLDWPTTTSFKVFLQGFHPAPLLAIRTVKAEIVCALPAGKKEELDSLDKSWMAHGDYGLVQFA